MDEGSTVTLIDSKVIKKIGVTGQTDPLEIVCMGKQGIIDSSSQRVTFRISAVDGTTIYDITKARTIKNLTLPIQSLQEMDIKDHPHIAKLPVERYVAIQPKMLIGQDYWELITPIRTSSTTRRAPVASLTRLGWVIHGRVGANVKKAQVFTMNHINMERNDPTSEDNLHELVKSSFSIDGLGVTNYQRKNRLDQRAEDILSKTARRICKGWEVGLMWKCDRIQLPNNQECALKRLQLLERKMDRNPVYAKRYCEQMEHLLVSKYCHKVTKSEMKTPQKWYLPHFGTTSASKPEKIRIVFDASAKSDGTSLNDNLLVGPDLVRSLIGVLFRFRDRNIAFTGDIKEMFLRIKIRKEDQWAQRFLWRDMNRIKDPDEYIMSSMTFGLSSSPCAATYVMNRNANEFENEYPQAVQAIRNKHYVDDYLDSVDTVDEAIARIKQVAHVHQQGGFEIRGWVSNSPGLMKHLYGDEKSPEILESIKNPQYVKKILGIKWRPVSDKISLNINSKGMLQSININSPTKRKVLKTIMSIYDPIGVLMPLIMRSRILMQNICRCKIDWDEKLEKENVDQWIKWTDDLEEAESYQVPRAHFEGPSRPKSIELHVYSDASEKGYSAVAYFRGIYENGKIVLSFVAGKARVAPLKPVSIPRLELQGALIACRLRKTISVEYESEIEKTFMWTDSRTVLSWIRTDPLKYQTFVANRLGEIDELSQREEWRWVPSQQNPADTATRSSGNIINQLNKWTQGPEYLRLEESQWPGQPDLESQGLPKCEFKKAFVGVTNISSRSVLPDLSRISKYMCLIRSTALIILSKDRWKGNKKSMITAELLEKAEIMWIKRVQGEDFAKEIKMLTSGEPVPRDSQISQLSPMVDEHGILRIDGRINAVRNVSGSVKCPIILNGKHAYTRLMIQYHHEKAGHDTPETVINELRQRYWILKIRPTVKIVAA